MFRLDKYIRKIDIQLDSGIYIFEYMSATGKTFLSKLLHQYRTIGEPVASYTYADFCIDTKLENILVPGRYKVVVIDRYDMYHSEEFEQLMYKCAKDTIILVDCKDPRNRPLYDDIVTIEIEKEWIRVY